jgi:MFS family permease
LERTLSDGDDVTDFGGDASPVTAPLSTISGRTQWRHAFASFRVFNFRLSFVGSLFNSIGGWMARIAIDWLVFELTQNVAAVGFTVALQFAPMLLLAPWAGVISDRYSRRRTLIITASLTTAAIALLAALVLAGHVEVWHVYVIAAFTGATSAIDAPSRSAFISEVVGTDRLRNAISLNAMTFHFGGLIGPAVSGVLIAVVGSGWSIAVNAATSAVALTMLCCMRTRELRTPPRTGRATGQIREAIAYAWAKPTIVWPLVLVAFVAVFGMQLPVLLTAAASPEGYGTGSAGYGLYSSMAAVGAFGGAFFAAGRSLLRLRSLVVAVLIYGLITAFIGIAPASALFLAGIVGAGATRVTFMVSADAMVQLSARATIRGRVVSLWIMVFSAGQAIGGPLMGWIAETFGVTIGFLIAGGMPALAAVTAAGVLAHRRRLRVRVDVRSPRRLVRIEQRCDAPATARRERVRRRTVPRGLRRARTSLGQIAPRAPRSE